MRATSLSFPLMINYQKQLRVLLKKKTKQNKKHLNKDFLKKK